MIEREKNIVIIFLTMLVVFLGLYIFYDKVLISNEKENEINNKVEEENTDGIFDDKNDNNIVNDNEKIENEVSCVVGTYYGEYSGVSSNNSFLKYDFKYKYTFNADGTYSTDFSGMPGENGTYTLKDGILAITFLPETGKGEMLTTTLDLSSDCSYITITGTDYTFKLNKQ